MCKICVNFQCIFSILLSDMHNSVTIHLNILTSYSSFLAYNLTNFFFVYPKFFSSNYDITGITQILYKIYFKKNSLKEEGGVITCLDSGKRECLALNFRHVSFLQVRKNNPCQADIHVYAVYLNNQTRFHFDV